MDELLAQFVIEARELTQQAAEDLLAIEREPGDRARLESAFRAVHTLKGSVGLFDLAPMQSVLHSAEDILGRAMHEGTELDPDRLDPLVTIIEWIDQCVMNLDLSGTLHAGATGEAVALAQSVAQGGAAPASAPLSVLPGSSPQWARDLFALDAGSGKSGLVALRYSPSPDCFFNGDDPAALMAAVPGVRFARLSAREPWPDADAFDPFRSNLVFEAVSEASRSEIEAIFRLIPDQVAIVAQPGPSPTSRQEVSSGQQIARTVRVEAERIDGIMAIVGELITAKNGMSALVSQAQAIDGGMALARSLAGAQQGFDRLVGQLQRAANGIRMVPVGETLRRLPRLVREISGQTGKPLEIDVSGGETEADKGIVDGLYDPLLHLIRNAVDHGIEEPDARSTAGKPLRGRISVSARQTGYHLELRIADDGRGIDPDLVLATAVARGLVDREEAGQLSSEQILELLFRPGFSTASAVTEISGRGIGMDAVRATVRRLNGTVRLSSEPGRGTTATLILPTQFALTRVIIVDVAGEQYGIPMDVVAETARVPSSAIVTVRSGEAFVHRNRTIPVLRLGDVVGRPAPQRPDELVLIVEFAFLAIGLVVDRVGERFETVLRPPVGLMKVVPGIAGTTVLGDGRVVMVLDPEALAA
ncbi:chemotaxis protein CheA [Bosea sp. BIWAKO-01]|uniref:chemotaxis protein CheA n=1 Tax=Bosea sp. BIWAKO-01 TaxID=506668 RepID=UPI000853A763|nr:chemotaxis protein CheA [Bosea sp. BIWAKO-01]GAU86475.1 signal transduction histidine kinase CheA [Bosea sp. BIWAKO-01]